MIDPSQPGLFPLGSTGLNLHSYTDAGAARQFESAFTVTWKQIPEEVRSCLQQHWRSIPTPMLPNPLVLPQIELRNDLRVQSGQTLGLCSTFGERIQYQACVFAKLPLDLQPTLIAHEFAHVYKAAMAESEFSAFWAEVDWPNKPAPPPPKSRHSNEVEWCSCREGRKCDVSVIPRRYCDIDGVIKLRNYRICAEAYSRWEEPRACKLNSSWNFEEGKLKDWELTNKDLIRQWIASSKGRS